MCAEICGLRSGARSSEPCNIRGVFFSEAQPFFPSLFSKPVNIKSWFLVLVISSFLPFPLFHRYRAWCYSTHTL